MTDKRRARLQLARVEPEGPSRERVKQAVRLFRSEYATRSLRRANARKWLACVAYLGPKWKLADPIRRVKEA